MVASTVEARALNRRQFLMAGAAAVALSAMRSTSAADAPARTAMGLATDVWDIHKKFRRDGASDPLAFLQQCHSFGAAGMQGPLGIRDEEYVAKLRKWAEERQLYIEGSVDLSGQRFDAERFEKEVVTAKGAGAKVVRTVTIPGRRYEQFNSADEFARASAHALEALQKVEPIMAKHKVRLAVENHKDHRIGERVELMKRVSSEYIGICVDVGNSFSLCEDPTDTAKAFAPWAFSVHLKDQAVREYEDGFLFADVALGKGFLDLPAILRVLREAHPEVKFSLEVITRNPLRVPVLTAKYWATMSGVPAADLARTMKTVKTKACDEIFPSISSLSMEEQIKAETQNIERSVVYARKQLRL